MSGFASSDLQAAVFQILSNDSAIAALVTQVWDQPSPTAVFPYIAIGDGEISDYSTKTDALAKHRFVVETWSDAAGRMQTKQIMDLVHEALHGRNITLASGTCIFIRFEKATDARDDESGSTLYRGTMTFLALISSQ